MHYAVTIGGKTYTVRFEERDGMVLAALTSNDNARAARQAAPARAVRLDASNRMGDPWQYVRVDGQPLSFGHVRRRDSVEIVLDGTVYDAEVRDARSMRYAALARRAAGVVRQAVKAPMPGMIVSVLVKSGAEVKKGQSLATLSAMKLENDIRCPRDGVVAEVHAEPGKAVEKGAKLIVLE